MVESCFSSLKKERNKKQIYRDRARAIADIIDYVGSFYNPLRHHRHLAGVSPEQFEIAHQSVRRGLH